MKTNISTNKDQSARLLRCGVSAETADMCWYIEFGKINKNKLSLNTEFIGSEFSSPKGHIEYIPAWSLSRLCGLLPKFIPDAGGDFSYALKIQPCNLPGWTVCYYAYSLDKGKGYHRSEDVIEACVQLIEWLTENGYKLNEI